jgi:hypothetical protein
MSIAARLAVRVVLERLVHPVSAVPAADHADMLSGGVRGLRDEGELRVERERDVTNQATQELVADRAGGALGKGAEQVPVAEPRTGLIGVERGRHEPATRHRC